jgi:hypothetical protein
MQVVPRPFGQVLGDSMNTVGRTWRSLAPPALLAFIPAGLATLLVFRETGAVEVFDKILNEPAFMQTLPRETVRGLLLPFYRAVGLAGLINMVAAAFVYLASHRIVAADIAGASPPRGAIGETLRQTTPAFLAWLIAAVAGALLLVVGLTLWMIPASLVGAPNTTSVLIAGVLLPILVGPAIWLLVSASVVTPVVALERLGVLESLRRSISLVRGRWWPTLGYLLLIGLFGVIALQLIQFIAIPLMALGGAGLAVNLVAILGIVTQGLIVAGIGAMLTWWYVDLRARKETLLGENLH